MKVFWSYAKRDDANPHHVTQLRDAFANVLGQCLGQDVELFQDTTGLNWGDEWRKKLESELATSDGFVCVLSPSYFNSKMCMQELVWAMDHKIKVYPILYRNCKNGLKSHFSVASDTHVSVLNEKSILINDIQYADFTHLRNKAKDSAEVLEFLDGICEQMA
jgi:hypothetical protein